MVKYKGTLEDIYGALNTLASLLERLLDEKEVSQGKIDSANAEIEALTLRLAGVVEDDNVNADLADVQARLKALADKAAAAIPADGNTPIEPPIEPPIDTPVEPPVNSGDPDPVTDVEVTPDTSI